MFEGASLLVVVIQLVFMVLTGLVIGWIVRKASKNNAHWNALLGGLGGMAVGNVIVYFLFGSPILSLVFLWAVEAMIVTTIVLLMNPKCV